MVFLAVLALASLPPVDAPLPSGTALVVEARVGSVDVADERGVHTVAVRAQERFHRYAYLELGHGERARLSLPSGQVDLLGPAVVEWAPERPACLLLHDLRAAELVARGAPLRLEWAGWAFELDGGAASLRRSGRILESRVHAARSFRSRAGLAPTVAVPAGSVLKAESLPPALPAEVVPTRGQRADGHPVDQPSS